MRPQEEYEDSIFGFEEQFAFLKAHKLMEDTISKAIRHDFENWAQNESEFATETTQNKNDRQDSKS